ncbi:TetR/AcrR family transcriptional regulator [Mycobacterium bourgelatii]|uniref:TetR family transcriptional regulator n=1 Tax=Mycobacterium bourgelatii TaxID=1273442 RepID=A0A7I9YL53_MYCBU|nr:TetR/AcrR family transcriptional regulator [Mycobacterium bourgelatii]MCV6975716.1 TetR/AcrR family transcriptional regulator [Mycobacterium bourgelatii]GFG89302.1 TetR family transcriptional regulator [Mycobacterium bourgelatii]
MTSQVRTSVREAQRLQTRQRVLGAALAEFQRSGMAAAEVSAIISAAGVAHGTFFFHFPTKEHVLLELEAREEARLAAELARFLGKPHGLADALTEAARLVVDLEQRLGGPLFRDFLGIHFSPTRPKRDEEWTDHPVIVLLVKEIQRARDLGEVHAEVDPFYSAVFFLLGIYGALSTTPSGAARDTMVAELIATAIRSLEPR